MSKYRAKKAQILIDDNRTGKIEVQASIIGNFGIVEPDKTSVLVVHVPTGRRVTLYEVLASRGITVVSYKLCKKRARILVESLVEWDTDFFSTPYEQASKADIETFKRLLDNSMVRE